MNETTSIVKVIRTSELKPGDILVFPANFFHRPSQFHDAFQAIYEEAKRNGVEMNAPILIAEPRVHGMVWVLNHERLKEMGYVDVSEADADAKRWRRLKQIWQREGFVNLNRKEGHKPFMETIVDTDQPDLCECCSLVEEVVGPVCETEEEALEAFSQLVKKKSANE